MIIVRFDAERWKLIAVDESDVASDHLAAVLWQAVELGAEDYGYVLAWVAEGGNRI
jgi:hypothetical protein